MPKPGTQLNGTVSKRGVTPKVPPTKKMPEAVARIAEAISRGYMDADRLP
jgi:hypothetical protein